MRKKQMLSLFMLVMGVALLVAATTVGAASSASQRTGKAGVTKGGTLRVNEANADFDFVDPQLAYRTDDWDMLFSTAMQLVSFPEKSGAAGSQLYPQAATAFPTVSKDGKTYTFTIRSGLKFSDGTPVTAAAYQRSWERILSPKMGSPLGVNLDLQNTVVGGADFLAGKTQHISGITAKGQKLTFHLVKPNATFVSILSMQWFTAVKPNMPYSADGLNTYPAAGPYYIKSRDPGRSTVLARNPYYKGNRPANPDQIVITPNVNVDQSLLQIKAGQADFDLGRHPADGRVRPRQHLRHQQGPLLRRRHVVRGLHGHEHRPCSVQQREPAEGRQLGDRPSGPGSPARRIRRRADGPDPGSRHPRLQEVHCVRDQGR